MRWFDSLILVVGIIAVLVWSTYSSKDGFKGSDAMIVARSTSFSATLGGHVDNEPPAVGTKLNANDLLVRIHNGRVDRTRLVEFETQRDYLQKEIESTKQAHGELAEFVQAFEHRAADYQTWFERDVEIRKTIILRRLDVAEKRSTMKADEYSRLKKLMKMQHASKVDATDARANSLIAASEAALIHAELKRSELLLATVQGKGMSSVDGDTNYWEKMVDALRLRLFDSRGKLTALHSELTRTVMQADAEAARIASDFSEEHIAPFSGVVNAVFVTEGARVAPGSSLVQLLDCSNPTVVIPIPGHRMGEFDVGMKATVYPVDSEGSLSGTVTHISSGPLLGHDSSIQLPSQLTLKGNRAIVSLDDASLQSSGDTCETARDAVAVIHSDSLFDSVSAWFSTRIPESLASALRLATRSAEATTTSAHTAAR